MNLNSMLKTASYTPISIQEPFAWAGHMHFAYWLIEELKPKIFVELGTHCGNSYFSFCQSVHQNNLLTNCYAVDTWQGDEHSGEYEDKVFAEVSLHNQNHYSNFSKLLRKTFDDALKDFENSSIGLLHIDGLHTYEAVLHDFQSWLPKLTPGAVVIFHDTNVFERNFGVWKLWRELQLIYPNNIEFFHSHGLGVFQLNNYLGGHPVEFLKLNELDKNIFCRYFSSLGEKQSANMVCKMERLLTQ